MNQNNAILSVVQVRPDYQSEPLEQFLGYFNQFFRAEMTEEDKLDRYQQHIATWQSLAGQYIKSGGTGCTDNIQEAQIFGWSRKAKQNLDGYRKESHRYNVVPVLIQVA